MRFLGYLILAVLAVLRWSLQLLATITESAGEYVARTLVDPSLPPKNKVEPAAEEPAKKAPAKPAKPRLSVVGGEPRGEPKKPSKGLPALAKKALLEQDGFEIETLMKKDGMAIVSRNDGRKMLVHCETWDILQDHFEEVEAEGE
jgi:hypothetical protein